jgi:hypothetical protein
MMAIIRMVPEVPSDVDEVVDGAVPALEAAQKVEME